MAIKNTDVIIANPIYDVVFKNLMTTDNDTNRENARYFVSTVLDEKIVEIDLLPQEYTYYTKSKKDKGFENEAAAKEAEKLSIIRLDFIATIRTKNGELKKVMIELQKYQKPENIMRFRNYLGEQYRQVDKVQQVKVKKGKDIGKEEQIEVQPIPIIFIYIFGYSLTGGYDTAAVKIDKKCTDLISRKVMEKTGKSPYIDSLTHESYYIQVPRITKDWNKRSKLEQLLSLFEQDYFLEENYIKQYPYPITNKNIKQMIATLERIASDPVSRRIMQEEYWAALEYDIYKKQERKIATMSSKVAAQSNQIEAKDSQIAAQSNQIAAKDSQIEELRQLLQQAGIKIPDSMY
jgi:uncharacterized coiled-coil protein SlyX